MHQRLLLSEQSRGTMVPFTLLYKDPRQEDRRCWTIRTTWHEKQKRKRSRGLRLAAAMIHYCSGMGSSHVTSPFGSWLVLWKLTSSNASNGKPLKADSIWEHRAQCWSKLRNIILLRTGRRVSLDCVKFMNEWIRRIVQKKTSSSLTPKSGYQIVLAKTNPTPGADGEDAYRCSSVPT